MTYWLTWTIYSQGILEYIDQEWDGLEVRAEA